MQAIVFRRAALSLTAAFLTAAVPAMLAAEPQIPGSAGANADSANPAVDPKFKEPFIDVDERRDAQVRHRYVHGGFKGTDLRFSFHLPPKPQYQARLFQYVTPIPDSEHLSQCQPIFPVALPACMAVTIFPYLVPVHKH